MIFVYCAVIVGELAYTKQRDQMFSSICLLHLFTEEVVSREAWRMLNP